MRKSEKRSVVNHTVSQSSNGQQPTIHNVLSVFIRTDSTSARAVHAEEREIPVKSTHASKERVRCCAHLVRDHVCITESLDFQGGDAERFADSHEAL